MTVAPPVHEEQTPTAPESILDRCMVRRGNKVVAQVLVSWSNLPANLATWEDYWSLKEQFPGFDP